MLVDKTIKVEKEPDELVAQLVVVAQALMSGTSVFQVVVAEVMKLQQLADDFKALGADYQESFSGTLKAVLCNSADLAAALLKKS